MVMMHVSELPAAALLHSFLSETQLIRRPKRLEQFKINYIFWVVYIYIYSDKTNTNFSWFQ